MNSEMQKPDAKIYMFSPHWLPITGFGLVSGLCKQHADFVFDHVKLSSITQTFFNLYTMLTACILGKYVPAVFDDQQPTCRISQYFASLLKIPEFTLAPSHLIWIGKWFL